MIKVEALDAVKGGDPRMKRVNDGPGSAEARGEERPRT